MLNKTTKNISDKNSTHDASESMITEKDTTYSDENYLAPIGLYPIRWKMLALLLMVKQTKLS